MRIISKIKREIDNAVLFTRATLLSQSKYISNDVPYVSQFANAEWAEKILRDGKAKTSDPDWRLSGASSVHEYEKWVTTICGMACTVMALDYFNKSRYQTITLAKDAFTYGVYQEHSNKLSDMHYKEYIKWIQKYHISANLYSRLTLSGIKYILSNNGLVIASVNPNLRGYGTVPTEQKGGHLVLVTGYNDKDGTLTLQNPSGFVDQNTHHNHMLDIKSFSKHFAGRGIALYSTNKVTKM